MGDDKITPRKYAKISVESLEYRAYHPLPDGWDKWDRWQRSRYLEMIEERVMQSFKVVVDVVAEAETADVQAFKLWFHGMDTGSRKEGDDDETGSDGLMGLA